MDASELSAGDDLLLADGGTATIVSVTRERLASPRDVYNFEVEGFHTYFVASAGVWVHNACSVQVKGVTRGQHRYHANRQLYMRLTSDPEFSARMTKKYGDDVAEFIANKGRRNLKGTQWHHSSLTEMKLMSKVQHLDVHRAKGSVNWFSVGVKKGHFRK